ncbi:putative G-protein coupled receptor [Trichinella spiralis]|uniref:Putative G-protein coupled receptor n=1 Tax=Trichinella spiralis TaxID=6334 RepID=A0A0V1BC92_TRISP|nr:putative G-protein coupled receptor [Trichinella spiralis]
MAGVGRPASNACIRQAGNIQIAFCSEIQKVYYCFALLILVHQCAYICCSGVEVSTLESRSVKPALDSRQSWLRTLTDYFKLDKMHSGHRCGDLITDTAVPENLMHNLAVQRHGSVLASVASLVGLLCRSKPTEMCNESQTLETFLFSVLRISDCITEIGLQMDNGSWRLATRDLSLGFTNATTKVDNNFGWRLGMLISTRGQHRRLAASNRIGNYNVTYLWQVLCDQWGDKHMWQVIIFFNSSKMYHGNRYLRHSVEMPPFYISIPMHTIDVNQCDDSPQLAFRSTHGCDRKLTRCVFVPNGGFRVGSFKCCCLDGDASDEYCINGSPDGESLQNGLEILVHKCSKFVVDMQARNDPSIMSKVFLAINVFSILGACILIFVLATNRKIQECRSARITLMELALVGAILMYCKMVLEFFTPQKVICCLITWCRQLGFTVFYGALVLTIYSNMLERRPRRSNQNINTDRSLLKDIGYMIAFTTTGLIAWTMAIFEFEESTDSVHIVSEPSTTSNTDVITYSRYSTCALFKWHFVWHATELCLLFYGIYLCVKSRSSFSAKRNRFFVAILIEIIVTTIINAIKYKFWMTFTPSMTMLLSFVQVHLTITLITVIILSKVVEDQAYYGTFESSKNDSNKLSDSKQNHSSLAKLRDRILNGTLDFAELPITDMNPEDIRVMLMAELKRVYTQLRMFKVTNMYVENPHIYKKKVRKQSHPKRASLNQGVSKSLYDGPSSKTETEEASAAAVGSGDPESPNKPSTNDYTQRSLETERRFIGDFYRITIFCQISKTLYLSRLFHEAC